LVEFLAWLILVSIEVFGIALIFAQLSKKIQHSSFRMRVGWGFFAGGLTVKIMLYVIEIISENL